MADEQIPEHEQSNQNTNFYVGVDPIYQNSADVTNRPYLPEDQAAAIGEFVNDQEESPWNGRPAAYRDYVDSPEGSDGEDADQSADAEKANADEAASQDESVKTDETPKTAETSRTVTRPAARNK